MTRFLVRLAAVAAVSALSAAPALAQTPKTSPAPATTTALDLSGVDVVGQRVAKCPDAACVQSVVQSLSPEGLKTLREICLNTDMRRINEANLRASGGLMASDIDPTTGFTVLQSGQTKALTCDTADAVARQPLYSLAVKANLGPLSPELTALAAQEDSRGGGLVELVCQTEGGDPDGALRNCQAKPGTSPDPVLLKSATLRVQETMRVVVQKGSPKPKAHTLYSVAAPVRFKAAEATPTPAPSAAPPQG